MPISKTNINTAVPGIIGSFYCFSFSSFTTFCCVSNKGVSVGLFTLPQNRLAHMGWKRQYPLKVRVFVKAQIVGLEQSAVDVPAQVTVETRQNRFAHGPAAIRVDVAKSPGEAPAIAVVSKGVWYERTWSNRWYLDQ